MSEMAPAGWYPDVEVPGGMRYWDGAEWTEHRQAPPAPPASIPAPTPPPPAMPAAQPMPQPGPAAQPGPQPVPAAQPIAASTSAVAPAKPKRRIGRLLLVAGAAVVVLAIAISALGSKSPAAPASNPSSTPSNSDTVQPTNTDTAPATTAPVGPPVGTVLQRASGSGMKSLPPFTTDGPWNLIYTYDCSSFGSSGNFQVYDNDPSNLGVLANELGNSGGSTQYQSSTGSHQLQVNSECDWTLKAVTAN